MCKDKKPKIRNTQIMHGKVENSSFVPIIEIIHKYKAPSARKRLSFLFF